MHLHGVDQHEGEFPVQTQSYRFAELVAIKMLKALFNQACHCSLYQTNDLSLFIDQRAPRIATNSALVNAEHSGAVALMDARYID